MAYFIKAYWKDRLAWWVWEKYERYWLYTGVYMILGYEEGDRLPWWSPSLLIRGRQSAFENRQLGHRRRIL